MYKIGIDGGGTKTLLIAVDQQSTIIITTLYEGCNPSVVGKERAFEILRNALEDLKSKLKEADGSGIISHTLLCLAGNGYFWKAAARNLKGFGRIIVTDDSLPIIEAALRETPGVVAHAGTGSFVAARDYNGKIHYAGGYGWRYGEFASGCEIGRIAIKKTILELQGWKNRSNVGRYVCSIVGSDDLPTVLDYFEKQPLTPRVFGSIAPRILELANAGEQTALEIVGLALAEMPGLIDALVEKVFGISKNIPIRLSGSILRSAVSIKFLKSASSRMYYVSDCTPSQGLQFLLDKLDLYCLNT